VYCACAAKADSIKAVIKYMTLVFITMSGVEATV
jgi:hypothetical protein